jgi:four helix bundle protein
MKIERFEDIEAWKNAKELTLKLYEEFKGNADYAFKNQILRASGYIMNNIAEGFERRSNKELTHFLYIAKGSSGEVRSMLYIARELNYIDEEKYKSILELSLIISRMLSNFIKKL